MILCYWMILTTTVVVALVHFGSFAGMYAFLRSWSVYRQQCLYAEVTGVHHSHRADHLSTAVNVGSHRRSTRDTQEAWLETMLWEMFDFLQLQERRLASACWRTAEMYVHQPATDRSMRLIRASFDLQADHHHIGL